MNQRDDTENPFAAPATIEPASASPASPTPQLVLKQTTFLNALGRWALIVSVSAAPSFLLGMIVTNGIPVAIIAMLIGVAIFILGFAFLDTLPFWRIWMSRRIPRRVIMTSFGIRLFVSIVFPIGFSNDMVVGMISTTGTSALFGENGLAGSGPAFAEMGAVQTLLTTLVCGVLLNCEVLALAVVFLAIFVCWDQITGRDSASPLPVSLPDQHPDNDFRDPESTSHAKS